MVALLLFFVVIILSIIIVRIGAIALRLTGLSNEIATFQAQSAFSGVGFTTTESEMVMSHPVRRKIVRILILLGSAGFTSSIATLILALVGQSTKVAFVRIAVVVGGIVLIYLTTKVKFVNRVITHLIERFLNRYPRLKILDYEQLFGLGKGYSIGEIKVHKRSWVANKTLKELRLSEEGVLVLAVRHRERKYEKFFGAPRGDYVVQPGDVLICYGREEVLHKLSKRIEGTEGDKEHKEIMRQQKSIEQLEKEAPDKFGKQK